MQIRRSAQSSGDAKIPSPDVAFQMVNAAGTERDRQGQRLFERRVADDEAQGDAQERSHIGCVAGEQHVD